MASIKWSNEALRDIEQIDAIVVRRILEKISWFQKNFADIVPERLHREFRNFYKFRIGDYRVVYSVSGDRIIIEAIGHRRDIYR